VRRAIPDAIGQVRVLDGRAIPFWLEVDRGTHHGRALRLKLERYYAVDGLQPRLGARARRILMVVAQSDEARLLNLQRRIRELDDRYQARLDVLLTRADLLDVGLGRLNPLLPAWRTAHAPEFVSAFDVVEQ
jgi:hypothetical protein